MNKRMIGVILCAVLMLPLTGCWDNKELNRREIISAMGIDYLKEKQKYLVSYEYKIPVKLGGSAEGSSSQTTAMVITQEVDTMPEAFIKMNKILLRTVYLQKCRMILLGEEVAKNNRIESFINYFFRFFEFRTSAYIIVVPGRAYELLQWQAKEAPTVGQFIDELFQSNEIIKPEAIPDLRLFRYVSSTDTKSFHAQMVELQKDYLGTPSIELGPIALFKKYTYVGSLSMEESRAFRLLNNSLKYDHIEPEAETADPHKKVTYHILKSKTKIIPRIEGDKMRIEIVVTCQGNVETNTTEYRLSSAEDFAVVEKKITETISQECEACLDTLKDFNTDALGFGEAIYRKYPREWQRLKERWGDEFPEIPVTLKITAKINGVGMIIDKNAPGREGY